MPNRRSTLLERGLMAFMLKRLPNTEQMLAQLPTAEVEEMNDGGMGSLLFVSNKKLRKFGSSIAEIQFDDVDKTPVLASIYLDEEGELFELDIWKVDFTPLKRIPVF